MPGVSSEMIGDYPKRRALQTQNGGLITYRISARAALYLLFVNYEPKYASKTCFATLNPSRVRT